MEPLRYLRLPAEVEAIKTTKHNFEEVAEWCGAVIVHIDADETQTYMMIDHHLRGLLYATVGDYIIHDVELDDFHPLTRTEFLVNYQYIVEETPKG